MGQGSQQARGLQGSVQEGEALDVQHVHLGGERVRATNEESPATRGGEGSIQLHLDVWTVMTSGRGARFRLFSARASAQASILRGCSIVTLLKPTSQKLGSEPTCILFCNYAPLRAEGGAEIRLGKTGGAHLSILPFRASLPAGLRHRVQFFQKSSAR